MSASPDVIAEGDLRPARTPQPAARFLKPVFLATASLLTLAGFALVAAALRAPYGLVTALLGFAGYIFLMSKALRCLPFDWDVWTNRRMPALPPPPRGRRVSFDRTPAAW